MFPLIPCFLLCVFACSVLLGGVVLNELICCLSRSENRQVNEWTGLSLSTSEAGRLTRLRAKECGFQERKIGNAEHRAHVGNKEPSLHGVGECDPVPIDTVERGAFFSFVAVDGERDEDRRVNVAETPSQVREPVKSKDGRIIGVTSHPHADAEEGHADAGHRHEGNDFASAVALTCAEPIGPL